MCTAPRIWLISSLALTLAGCGGQEVSATGRSLPDGPARRVILITCDTLRADHLSSYGYGRPTSPRIDELAKESVLFTNAWSAAPRTMPAVSSLLTGRLPDEIGATPSNMDLMPAEALTLAEVMRDAGFGTAAIVANSVLRRADAERGDIGVQQGFVHFDDTMTQHPTINAAPERDSDAVTDAALKWLAARGADEDRFLLWVHYMDPHGPYLPAAEHLAPFVRDHAGESELPVAQSPGEAGAIPLYQVVGEERKPGQYVDRYDGEIHQVDAEVGRLLDALRARGWLEDALVVFTSDHGESLGESNRWFSHGDSLQRELVHVPLIVRPPQSLRENLISGEGGRRNGKLVMHLDVWPTVLRAIGIPGHPNRGLSLLQSKLPEGRISAHFFGRLDTPRRMISVTDGRWHMVTIGPKFPTLYDMSTDPRETTNVVAANPAIMQRLQARYDEFMSQGQSNRLTGTTRVLDEKARRGMNSLGYTGGDDH
ncbi:MAG: sulfatase [Planctomycetes bacterium]|nr:sulfatase [Planctomycetota bacterium]